MVKAKPVESQVIQAKYDELSSLYEAVLGATRDGIWDWPDMEKDEEYWSPQWKKLLGYEEHEIEASAKLFFEMLHPDDRATTEQAVADHVERQIPFDVEYRLKTKSEEYKWFRAKAIVRKDPMSGKMRMTGSITDIDEQKLAEQRLEESNAFLELMMNNNPDLVFVKDEEFKLVQANPAFMNLYPKEKQDKIIGYTTIEEYNKEDSEAFLYNDRKAFSEGYSEVLEKIDFPNGENKSILTRKIRFYNRHEKPFILGLATDVTEREDLIQRLTESNEELEHFAFIASHDLQEPLRMISSFTDLLKEEYQGQFDEKALRYIDFVSGSAVRMQNLVRDLLEYSKLGQEEERFMESNLDQAIDVVETNLMTMIKDKQATITHDKLPILKCNPIRMVRLLQNLVSNGMKYCAQKPKIHISASKKDKHWEFKITDNGIGIKPQYLEKIFIPFKRLHSHSEYAGTGIGLSVCKKIVNNFGGEIWAESEYGKGSSFYFTFPI